MIAKIKKRDGTIVAFQKEKIRIAMEKAAGAVNPAADLRAFDIMADHAVRHIEIQFRETVADVESVQDLVERTLMEYGLFEVAKVYILYRAERTKIREAKKKDTAEGQKEAPKLHFVEASGKRHPLTARRLETRFTAACQGLAGTDIAVLVEHSFANCYDGMSEEELAQALILTARAFIERDPDYSQATARLALSRLYDEVFGPVTPVRLNERYRTAFITTVKEAVEAGRLTPSVLEFDLEALAAALVPERDELLGYLGFQTLYDRYLLREEGGERRLETPQAFWLRVAMGLATGEGEEKNARAKQFYDVMSTLRYIPSTPTLFHAGTTYPQLSSCYLNTVDDDLHHIFKVYSDNAQLSKFSGGIGTDWTNVRATNAPIKSINVPSQGVIPFIRIANDVTVAINRSGKRRGATCVYLETWHLDIEEFLELRKNTGDERRRAHDINTANWIPDLFVQRVIEGGNWTLFSPDEVPGLHDAYGQEFAQKYVAYEKRAAQGKIRLFKTVPAKELWRKMMTMLFETGHPWVTFKDPANIRSPQDHVGVIHSSNLCTEITLNTSTTETAVCNLGSVNLARHMKNGALDPALLKGTVATAIRLLDNVIDLNFYPTEESEQANLRHRPVGLGVLGFQDALFLADIDFDSEEAVEFADTSMEFISYHAIGASARLARERGAYPSYPGSKWDRGIFPLDTLDLLEASRGMPVPVARTSRLDWTPVREAVAKWGMRNSNTLAIAPTATIANISGCFPCIEPIYQNLYVKSNMSGEFTMVNHYLVRDLKRLGLWHETMLEELKRHDGNVREITSIPPRLREKYKSVFDLDPEWLIKIAAYRGKWLDQSQSLNIFYAGASGRRLSDIYLLAWHLGLKTTYYLRTLAATAIEKSTLDLATWQALPEAREHFAPEEAAAPPEIAAPTPPAAETAPVTIGQACNLDDPDCEACQ